MPPSPIVLNPALEAYSQAAKRAAEGSGSEPSAGSPRFGDLLAKSIGDAVDAGTTSENLSIQAASGRSDLQHVVEAVNAAEISLQTVVSIRDRVISAYQEILRMPI